MGLVWSAWWSMQGQGFSTSDIADMPRLINHPPFGLPENPDWEIQSIYYIHIPARLLYILYYTQMTLFVVQVFLCRQFRLSGGNVRLQNV